MIRKAVVAIFCGILAVVPAGMPDSHAADYILEYVGENYKETTAPYSNEPVIYHAIQVKSAAGSKMLILTGDDVFYRRWLRQYIAAGKQLIVQVPEESNDLFIRSSAFEIDVTRLHPFNLPKYREALEKDSRTSPEQPMDDPVVRPPGVLKKRADLKPKDRQALDSTEKKGAKNKARNPDLLRKADQRSPETIQRQNDRSGRLEQELAGRALQQRLGRRYELARQAAENTVAEQQRKARLQQRWQELKARLMEAERIRRMEVEARHREIERHWLELQQRLQID